MKFRERKSECFVLDSDFIIVPKTKIIITVNMNTCKVIHKKYTYKTIVQDSM